MGTGRQGGGRGGLGEGDVIKKRGGRNKERKMGTEREGGGI